MTEDALSSAPLSLWRSFFRSFDTFCSDISTALSVMGELPILVFGSTATCALCKNFMNKALDLKPCIEEPPVNPSIQEILTYNYCLRDVLINYSIIAVIQITTLVQGMPAISIALSTFYLWTFQVVLCRGVGCIGVSIVWSAQMGILFRYRRRRQATRTGSSSIALYWYRASMTCGIASWAYYAAVSEPITTVAHLSALAMGCFLDVVVQLVEPPPFPSPAPPPPIITSTWQGDEASDGESKYPGV
jgi:hypothetical protein